MAKRDAPLGSVSFAPSGKQKQPAGTAIPNKVESMPQKLLTVQACAINIKVWKALSQQVLPFESAIPA